jgi:hypothetical protein
LPPPSPPPSPPPPTPPPSPPLGAADVDAVITALMTSSRGSEPATTDLKDLMAAKDSDAKCLDGNTPSLYYRPAQANVRPAIRTGVGRAWDG